MQFTKKKKTKEEESGINEQNKFKFGDRHKFKFGDRRTAPRKRVSNYDSDDTSDDSDDDGEKKLLFDPHSRPSVNIYIKPVVRPVAFQVMSLIHL